MKLYLDSVRVYSCVFYKCVCICTKTSVLGASFKDMKQ